MERATSDTTKEGEIDVTTTYPEGWLRLTSGDARQHFFRDGMSACGKYVSPATTFPDDDGPDPDECTECRSIVDDDNQDGTFHGRTPLRPR